MLPEELRRAIDEALEIVEQHPDHEYGPQNRKRLMTVFKTLGTPLADRARRRLSIVTVRHVLPLHSGPHMPESERSLYTHFHRSRMTAEERRLVDEEMRRNPRYEEPRQALALAERVMRGEFDPVEANRIAGDMHYSLGYARSVPSMFVQSAANKALGEVSKMGDPDWLVFLYEYGTDRNTSDISWHGDSAACAAAACCCISDAAQVDPDKWPDNWNWWIMDKPHDRAKLLEFWRWWLLEGVPQAWVIEEEAAKSLTDSQGG